MKLKLLRWIALISGSVVAAISLLFVIGTIVQELTDGDNDVLFDKESWNSGGLKMMLRLTLPTALIIFAWFKNKWGAFFLITLPLIELFIPELTEQFDIWLQLSLPLLIVGILLLFYVYYNKFRFKKT